MFLLPTHSRAADSGGRVKIVHLAALLLVLLSISADAQEKRNELGFLLGFETIPDVQGETGADLRFSRSIAYSVSYARHLAGENTALLLEAPFAAVPSHKVRSREAAAISSLATLYLTPSLKLRFANRAPASPWISGGFGYGLYEGSRELNSGLPNPNLRNSTGTFQFGGGVDVKTPVKFVWPIGLRAELRDYYTLNTPAFGTPVRSDGQHNIIFAAGFMLRF